MNKCTYRSLTLIGLFSFFLVNTANAWTIDQSYDSESIGNRCAKWGTSKSVVSDDKSASGNKSCKQIITAGSQGFGEWGGTISFPSNLSTGDEIWIRLRTYYPTDFIHKTDGKLKYLRVKTHASDGSHRGYDDWYLNNYGASTPFKFIYEGRQDLAWHDAGKKEDGVNLGVWETYEFYIKFDAESVDNGGTGRMRAWKNGVLLKDMLDRVTLKEATDYASSLYIFTWWANDGAINTQHMYIDDLLITNERPLNTDASGNPAIGMGGYVPAESLSRPKPPTITQ